MCYGQPSLIPYLFHERREGQHQHYDFIILVCNIVCECEKKKMEEDYTWYIV